jgi:hypothetical protein
MPVWVHVCVYEKIESDKDPQNVTMPRKKNTFFATLKKQN